MSFYSKFNPKLIRVKSQYDYPEVDNQCSWCVYQFASNLNMFYKTIDIEKYNNHIKIASELKKKYSKKQCGENIDDSILEKLYPTINIIIKNYIEINHHLREEFISLFPQESVDTFYTPKKKSYVSSLLSIIKNDLPYPNRFLMINRFGQSFLIIGTPSKEVYIIDTHLREIIICNIDNVINYIIPINCDKSYYVITYIYGII